MEDNKHTLWFALLVVIALSGYGLYSETRKELDTAKEQIARLSGESEETIVSQQGEISLKEEELKKSKENEELLQEALDDMQSSEVGSSTVSAGDIINQYAPSVVRLVCVENTDTGDLQQGSGVLFEGDALGDGGLYYVQTNLHVIETSKDDFSQCVIAVYPDPDNSESYITYKSSGHILFREGVDLAYLKPLEVKDGKRAGLLSSLSIYALKDSAVTTCNAISIGDHISVLGYPGIGGESLTVTDGIVSGFEFRSGERYIKTSAKIDQGNSGGIAIMDSGCIVGIPTYVKTQIESLGRILDLKNL
ncbi:MAG: serine protease [Candidatus Colwellbacteria bacterium]|nr:serine protease [Candidatus Colwellbacteria bacterium]